MKRAAPMLVLLIVGLFFFSGVGLAQEEKAEEKGEKKVEKKVDKKAEKHTFVGARKCKLCHKAQYASWAETKHATAYDVLSEEEKKKKECVSCHITGMTKKGVLLEGVQCEACHGPGSHYKSPKIMSKKKWAADPETYKTMAIEAGLIYPAEEDCVRCHKKEGNPNFKPFDFEKRKGEVHLMMEPEEEAAEGKEDK